MNKPPHAHDAARKVMAKVQKRLVLLRQRQPAGRTSRALLRHLVSEELDVLRANTDLWQRAEKAA